MIVVLDCNILVMSLTSRSPYHLIYQSIISGKFRMVVSTAILLEYEEIIQNKYSTIAARSFIALLAELPNVIHVHPYYNWGLIKADEDDNKYCDSAIAGQAEFIVTEDRHFDALKGIPFPSLDPISIDHFLYMLQSM